MSPCVALMVNALKKIQTKVGKKFVTNQFNCWKMQLLLKFRLKIFNRMPQTLLTNYLTVPLDRSYNEFMLSFTSCIRMYAFSKFYQNSFINISLEKPELVFPGKLLFVLNRQKEPKTYFF